MGVIGGVVRRFTKIFPSAARSLRLTVLESLAIAQVEGEDSEAARSGRRFYGGTLLLANAIAPDTAMPTTAPKIALFNGDVDGGKTLHLDYLNFYLASGTPAAGATLLVTVSPQKIATPPAGGQATGYTVQSASASKASSVSRWAAGLTLPTVPISGLNAFWMPVLSNLQAAAANIGQGSVWARIRGGLACPPGCAFGFSIITGAGTTPLYALGAVWNEQESDLE